jgi:hypothetical protein
MVEKFKQEPDFAYSKILVDNNIRVNSIDAICYSTTGCREEVLSAWLNYLIGSAVMTTSTRHVHFNGVAMFYGEERKSRGTTFYSYYRVGLKSEFYKHQYGKDCKHGGSVPVTVEVWYPLVFTSFDSVLQIADYLQGFSDIHLIVRAKEVKVDGTNSGVRLVKMKADALRSETFGSEKVLQFPTTWFFDAMQRFKDMSAYATGNSFDQVIDNVNYRIFTRGGVLNPRCDNSLIRVGGIANLAYSCNVGKPVLSAGGVFKTHITDPQVKWMNRNYISENLVSDGDMVLFMSHMISEWSK